MPRSGSPSCGSAGWCRRPAGSGTRWSRSGSRGGSPSSSSPGAPTHDGRPRRSSAGWSRFRASRCGRCRRTTTTRSIWSDAPWRRRRATASARSPRSSPGPEHDYWTVQRGDRAWPLPAVRGAGRAGGPRGPARGGAASRGAGGARTRDADRRGDALPGDAPGASSTSPCSAWPRSGAPSTSASWTSATTRKAGTGWRTTTRSAGAAAWC